MVREMLRRNNTTVGVELLAYEKQVLFVTICL